MPGVEIALKQRELLLGRPGLAGADHQILVPAQQLALRGVGLELLRHHAHRYAGGTVGAAWPVGDILAAAKADAAERVVEEEDELFHQRLGEAAEALGVGDGARILGTRGRELEAAAPTNA